MRRLSDTLFPSIVLLLSVNLLLSSAQASNIPQSRRQSPSQFQSWIDAGLSFYSFNPSSPDDWLGGTGNWSNPAGWSAGEPGGSSDVFINTGNDNVTLDVSASINSLTLGGTTGSSTLMDTSQVTLTIAGALTINPSGTVTFYEAGGITAGTVLNAGAMHLFHGGLSAGTITNSGVITLDVGSVNASGTLTNSGTIMRQDDVNGIGGATIVNSGTIFVATVGSSGDLTNQSGGSISVRGLTVGGNLMNAGLIQGYLERVSTFSVTGELTNSGTFDIEHGSSLTVGTLNNLAGGTIYDVSGSTTVDGNASNAGSITVSALGSGSAPGSLSIDGNLTNSASISVVAILDGAANATVSGNVVNSGTISATFGGSFATGGSITNSGTITTGQQNGGTGGSSVSASGTLANQAGGVLALYSVGDTATFGTITNAGTISVANGATLTVPPSSHAVGNVFAGFLNSGMVQIATGGTISSLSKYTQTAGQTTIDGTLHGPSNFAGGAVYGNGGTIEGNVTSNAAFNIGDMPMSVGMMTIMGNYTQGANGSLYVDIASLSSYDKLDISGHASLNGLLSVDLLNGYTPQVGNLFDIVNFSGSSGTFSMVLGLPINNNEHFVLEYNPTNLTLDVVSGPELQASSGHWAGSGDVYYEPYVSDGSLAANPAYELSSAPSGTVPEPGSLVLLASGIAGLATLRRKSLV